jgi:hypothetical protein
VLYLEFRSKLVFQFICERNIKELDYITFKTPIHTLQFPIHNHNVGILVEHCSEMHTIPR